MPFVATIIAASAAVSAGTSIYSAQQTAKAGKEANANAREQADRQNKLLADAKAAQDAERAGAESIAARDAARKRQRAQAASAQGRSSTILTGPLGLTDAPQGQYKTILGQ